MRIEVVLLLGAMGLAGPASAQTHCPVAADLEIGIQIDSEEGGHEVFSRVGDEIQVRQFHDDDNGIYFLSFDKGIFQTSYVDSSGSYRTDYTYAFDPEPTMPIRPGDHIGGTMHSEDTDGVIENIPYALDVGPIETVDIGDCSYDKITLTETLKYDDGLYVYSLAYLPALGFNYLESERGPDYGPDHYRATGIRAVNR